MIVYKVFKRDWKKRLRSANFIWHRTARSDKVLKHARHLGLVLFYTPGKRRTPKVKGCPLFAFYRLEEAQAWVRNIIQAPCEIWECEATNVRGSRFLIGSPPEDPEGMRFRCEGALYLLDPVHEAQCVACSTIKPLRQVR